MVWNLNIFIMLATVPIWLQTCAKILQMHLPGGAGTPWLQPKSKYTFKLSSTYLFEFLVDGFEFKYFHYGGYCAHTVANLCKSTANAPSSGRGGTLVATQK